MDVDELTGRLADAVNSAGLYACVQPPKTDGHVGWGGRYVSCGEIPGVRNFLVQDPAKGEWAVIARVTVADEGDHNGHAELGYRCPHPRVGTMRWRIAEGYVNGFPFRDILWYAITRWRGNRAYLKAKRRRQH